MGKSTGRNLPGSCLAKQTLLPSLYLSKESNDPFHDHQKARVVIPQDKEEEEGGVGERREDQDICASRDHSVRLSIYGKFCSHDWNC